MNMLKSVFSRLLTGTSSPSHRKPGTTVIGFPGDPSASFDLFEFLNFAIPELHSVKLSLDFEKKDKAFEQFLQYLRIRHSPVFLCQWQKRAHLIDTLNESYPDAVPQLLQSADSILQHRFLLFSAHRIQAGSPISWNTSYEEGNIGDREAWQTGQSYSSAELGDDPKRDIHFVWELNRHQHFLDLGKAYWATGEKRYVEEFITEITEWIEQNPYQRSVNWASSYEVALRGVFWLFGTTFFVHSDLIQEAFFCRFYRALLMHGHAVYDALRATSKPSQTHHLVAQAAFLYLLGTMCPEYAHSKPWNTFGWDILQWNTTLLTVEQFANMSLVSRVAVIELYCLVLAVRKANRYHISQKLFDELTGLFQQLALFMKPNGTLARFGAEHPRQLLTGMSVRAENFRYLFAMGAVLLKNPTFAAIGNTFPESLVWLFGNEGSKEFQALSSTSSLTASGTDSSTSSLTAGHRESCLAPNGEYAVMRSEQDTRNGYCIISTGMNASGASPELKHADFLNFELSANHEDYLIDSGAYSFHPRDIWNQYFCSFQAHNTVSVDRIQQINLATRHVESTFDAWITTPTFDFLSGFHTGFDDLQEPVIHRRSIFYYKPNYWIINDILTGEGMHFFDQFFHFPSFRLNVDFMNKSVDVQTAQNHHFLIMPLNPHEMDVSIFTGGETPDSGWMSDGYRREISAPLIKYGKRTIAPTSFHTLLYAYISENSLNISGRVPQVYSSTNEPLLCDEVSAIEISTPTETHYFALVYKNSSSIRFANITFSGKLFFLRKQEGEIVDIRLYKATLLIVENITLFQSETEIENLTLTLQGNTLLITSPENCTFRMQLPHITEVLVNNRKALLRRDDAMLLISTARV